MKNLIFPLLFILSVFIFSCSSESVGDLVPQEITDGSEVIIPDTPENVITTPCGFDLAGVSANETVVIDCLLDLNGETVTLPANVIFDFAGGDIINGKLIFAGGKIDGRLLSSKLDIEGEVELKDPKFTFYAVRWDLVEGQTNEDQAQKNVAILEDTFEFIKTLKGNTVQINRLDAFFDVSRVTSTTSNQNFYPSVEAINVPSDFTLIMTENTNLRVIPTNRGSGVLLAARDVENVNIIGGNLWGDRDQHVYSRPDAEEGQFLLMLHGARNVVVDGVTMRMGSAGSMNINSIGFTYEPHYIASRDIVIKNCLVEESRRMSLSITDGHDILIENNTFVNTGRHRELSDGSTVGYAINIEALRRRDEVTNELIYWERAYDIIIRNNTERGSRIGGITVSIGETVTIENNNMESKVVYSTTNNTKIINNTFTASEQSAGSPALIAGGEGPTVFNNEVSGNTFSGYGVAIAAFNDDVKINNNIINECISGIQIKNATNMTINGNKITSSKTSSKGVSAQLTTADNVTIMGNDISVQGNHLYFVELNQGAGEENFNVMVDNNMFRTPVSSVFSKTNGVTFQNNDSQGGLQLINASKISLATNDIVSPSHGVRLSEVNSEISITGNSISVPSGSFECIKDDSTNANAIGADTGNTCGSR
ncbi:right-handed parallel beta-helix repeat-containing protein [Aquimarina mytili]|uniref:Right-handed parallel beta-helix repeat-containing protein n=1 Tax=Aquimarina mytili TaxID=874423 RepID=A0A936ZWB6_9FLAO|nr:right-handed parallel beta-helix repeat-containing protein [Aquimarina mytili]MBL0683175.1 right-handed parallel beta-helix repeat-containing protein [Aquimarina mytili]